MLRKLSALVKRHRKGNEPSKLRETITPQEVPSHDSRTVSERPPNQPRSLPDTSFGEGNDIATLEANTLGLNVVYTPTASHHFDIVFVHGLGGTSRNTWTKSKDPDLFWPVKFLTLEPDLRLARILTFGYNAMLRKAGHLSTSTLDFAKALLFDLKYATDEQNQNLDMGRAYIQGQNDPAYTDIIRSITSIMFLATPHRGTDYAQTLNRIIQTTVVSNPKQYISELARNSLSLQKLNEQFRHVGPQIDLVSFYETRPTPVGSKYIQLAKKDSSVLGYPEEISRALDANHKNICKYDSPNDPNYVAVRNILKSLAAKALKAHSTRSTLSQPIRKPLARLKLILALPDYPEIDYSLCRDQWLRGTGEWIFRDNTFEKWKTPSSESRHSLLWLNGGAASGKSIMASCIINSLLEEGLSCQYFFIKYEDQQKRTLSLLLRSLAYQIAQQIPEFLTRLQELYEEGMIFETADPRIIWGRAFKSILFDLEDEQGHPLFWVIDGLDEAENPRAVVKVLSDLSFSKLPIRILFLGRKAPTLDAVFQRVPEPLSLSTISMEDHQGNDLRIYVDRELDLPGTPGLKETVAQRILDEANHSFLWVRLAVESMNSCHTQADVEIAFQQLPTGMDSIYDRMAANIIRIQHPVHRELAKTILQFSSCSLRTLTVTQLSEAVGESVSGVLDLKRSIVDLCGGFVLVDSNNKISLIHQTAREYLLESKDSRLRIDSSFGHLEIFLSCMRSLMTVGLRSKVSRNSTTAFVDYAATCWATHLSMIRNISEVSDLLNKFLKGSWVLTWIEYLIRSAQQRVLVRASRYLYQYMAMLNKQAAVQAMSHTQKAELENFRSWTIDLIKLTGKFGTALRTDPASIYKLIPPFCPHNSALYRLFGKAENRNILVHGLSAHTWDDLAARIPFGEGITASSISIAGPYIFVLASSKNLHIYNASTFEESRVSPIRQTERLYMFQVNGTGSLIATYGYRTTKVFDTLTGECKISVDNLESRPRPLVIQFQKKNTRLLVGFDDDKLRVLDLVDPSPTWQIQAVLEETELDGHLLNASNYMALNSDGSLLAVAYRGHPLSAWETEGLIHIGHCWRKRDTTARGEVIDASWLPHSPQLLGLYVEGVVFKWSPYENEVEEIAAGAKKLTVNMDGNLFATGDGRGTIRVFTTSQFALLYQLTSQDTVFDISFSTDSHRFYDIRGNYANVWEPIVLLSFQEQTRASFGLADDHESKDNAPVVETIICPKVDAITVLTTLSKGRLYVSGTENGAVQLHHAKKGRLPDINSAKGLLSIENISCSTDGQYLGFCNTSKKVVIKSVTLDTTCDSDPTFQTKAEIAMRGFAKGPILSLLFHPSSTYLLVHASASLHIISLLTGELSISQEQPGAAEEVFVPNPHDKSQILGFGLEIVRILDWNLEEQERLTYTTTFEKSPSCAKSNALGKIERVIVTRDKNHILVSTSRNGDFYTKERTLLYFATSSFHPMTAFQPEQDVQNLKTTMSITPIILPSEVTSQVAKILCFLPYNRLAFLSKTFAVCSYQIPSGPVKVLFFLPDDWSNKDCTALCDIWAAEKSFFCPKNGEVAIVSCAALA
ncbi:hypothetical protein S7711_04475 [Stachybotrys chartarum IBT 7711]|uniref:NACHT domain-containing protein n=1 Tax=Stachybotrys chartarum (strain CBS 109288 / IBT 7711) TaxID=1280523 RepID=A0A084BA58_STACB|nr:hypothetical protein S7711_04475 [Stachybotrys chartarum IBT 7711]